MKKEKLIHNSLVIGQASIEIIESIEKNDFIVHTQTFEAIKEAREWVPFYHKMIYYEILGLTCGDWFILCFFAVVLTATHFLK
jgi:hypothetical protein